MIEKTVSLSGQIQPDIIIGSMQDGGWERVAQHHGVWRDTIITERRSKIVGV